MAVEFLSSLARDLRYAVRALVRTPVFTAVAALVVALGIGANTAIFTFVNAYLVRPLPFPGSDRLVIVSDIRIPSQRVVKSPAVADFAAVERDARSLEAVAAVRYAAFNIAGGDQPELARGMEVSRSFFGTLGVTPQFGRPFTIEEDTPGGPRAAVLSYGLWQRRFAGNMDVLGRTVELNGNIHRVVGIMPPSFRFPDGRCQLWATLQPQASQRERTVMMIARLRDGIRMPQVADELAATLSVAGPMAGQKLHVRLMSLYEWANHLRQARAPILILFAAVAFVLLVACANVANLLLSRAVARAKENAIRTALGASRARIVGQALMESVLISALGGVFGLVLGTVGVKLLMTTAPLYMLPLGGLEPDRNVLLFTAGVSLLAGLIFGLAPAFQFSAARLDETLKQGGRSAAPAGRGWLRRALVVAEVAPATALLIGAGLLLESFAKMETFDFGFRPENMLVTELILPEARYPDPEQRVRFIDTALERAAAIRGVTSAGAVSRLGWGSSRPVAVDSQPVPVAGSENWVGYRSASGDYFRGMGVPLRAGRYFNDRDSVSAPRVVIVNETMARRFWPNGNAVGRTVRFTAGDRQDWMTVVGVVGDDRQEVLGSIDPEMYAPYQQDPPLTLSLVLQSGADPGGVARALRDAIRQMDKDQALADLETMEQRLAANIAPQRVTTELLGMFAGLALALAVIGLYGVIAYSVAQQKHDIGVRMALGATAGEVAGLVMRRGALLAGIGIAFGLAMAFAVTRLMTAILFGVTATDPVIFTCVPLVIGAAALVASYIPARRAAALDPVQALRTE